MEWRDVKRTKAEAERFLEKVTDLETRIMKIEKGLEEGSVPHLFFFGCKETAALKRASLDLSRALTELRKRR